MGLMSRVKETGLLLDVSGSDLTGDAVSVVAQACKMKTPMTTIIRAELDLNLRIIISPVDNPTKRTLLARRAGRMSQDGPKMAHSPSQENALLLITAPGRRPRGHKPQGEQGHTRAKGGGRQHSDAS
jgi:hypothetical protein